MIWAHLYGWELLTAVLALLLSYLMSSLMRRLAPHVGLMNIPVGNRFAKRTVALGGGIAWIAAMFLVIATGCLLAFFEYLPQELSLHQGGMIAKIPSLIWVCSGATALMLMGLIDDFSSLSPQFKLIVECAIALILSWQVPEILITAFVDNEFLNRLFTVLWIVGFTNCFNLLDHADGVSAVIAFALFLSLAILASLKGQLFIYLFCFLIIGALAGFLLHNWPPARLFMGDAGSLPLGYLVAIGTALFTFHSKHDAWTAVLTPLCLLLVPVYDVVSVIWIRWRENRPIFQGDRSHVTHRLIKSGWPHKKVLYLFFVLTLLGGAVAAPLAFLPWPWGFISIGFSMGIIFMMSRLER